MIAVDPWADAIAGTLDLLRTAGFDATSTQSTFTMRFADGTALLNHYFIKLAFLDSWQELAGAEVLGQVEQELNQRGELTLTIPTACFDAVRT